MREETKTFQELQQVINQMNGVICYLEQVKPNEICLIKFYRNARDGFRMRLKAVKYDGRNHS